MASSSTPKEHLRLIIWAPSTAAQSGLPTLDAASLYAVSLLKAGHLADDGLELSTPSSLLHRRVPLLESQASGLQLAQTPQEVLAFVRSTPACPATLLEAQSSSAASAAALASLVSRELSPICAQALWHSSLFASHTAAAYSAGLAWPATRSWPQGLRAAMREPLARRVKALGLPQASLDAELQERSEREEMAKRAGIRIKDGMTHHEKRKLAQRFGELKTLQHLRSVLSTLSHALGSDDFYFASTDPSPLDIQVFSELAPLLLASNHQQLFDSSIPTLLRDDFPNLVAHVNRVRVTLWPSEQGKAFDWPKGPIDDAESSQGRGVAYGLGHALGSVFRTVRATPALLSAAYAQRHAPQGLSANQASTPQRPVDPQAQAQQTEARKIARGRLVWIATAAVGAVITAFASGLLSIEFVDDEDDAELDDDAELQLHEQQQGEDGEVDDESEDLLEAEYEDVGSIDE